MLRDPQSQVIFGIWKNCQSSGRNLLLYPYKKCDQTDPSNYRGVSLISYIQNCIHHFSVKVNSADEITA
jgi:hypothetical protein